MGEPNDIPASDDAKTDERSGDSRVVKERQADTPEVASGLDTLESGASAEDAVVTLSEFGLVGSGELLDDVSAIEDCGYNSERRVS